MCVCECVSSPSPRAISLILLTFTPPATALATPPQSTAITTFLPVRPMTYRRSRLRNTRSFYTPKNILYTLHITHTHTRARAFKSITRIEIFILKHILCTRNRRKKREETGLTGMFDILIGLV